MEKQYVLMEQSGESTSILIVGDEVTVTDYGVGVLNELEYSHENAKDFRRNNSFSCGDYTLSVVPMP